MTPTTVSERGIDLIRHHEGCRLDAYQDSAGVWTIGYGHTGSAAQEGARITQAEAEDLLRADLASAESGVADLVSADLSQSQYDALVSFVFNVGRSALASSTLVERLNDGIVLKVPQELCRWIYAGGARSKGLARRRVAEAALFLED